MTVIEAIANAGVAHANCVRSQNLEAVCLWSSVLGKLERNCLPSGSGFDRGTHIHEVTEDKVVIGTSFHHMDEHGAYDGWTEHIVTVRASFIGGFTLTVGGRDRNGIKEFIAETLDGDLRAEVPESCSFKACMQAA